MSSQNSKFEIDIATQKDSDGIKKVFESGTFTGGMSIQFLRGEDPFLSLNKEGETLIVISRLKETNEIIGTGALIIRKAYIDGEIKKVGYLTAMKVLPEYQRKISFIPQVYKLLHEKTKDIVDVYYTTILKENVYAQNLLEKKRKSMPEYRYQGEYTVYCLATSKRCSKLDVQRGNTEGLIDFYNQHLPQKNLSCSDLDLYGLNPNDFFIFRKNGKIVASCGLWNQQEYKQYKMKSYNGIYKLASKLPTKWLGYPSFPKENEFVNYATLALFHCDESLDDDTIKQFLFTVCSLAKEYDVIMLGLFENSRYQNVLQKMKHVKYQSRLYTVNWNHAKDINDREIYLDVGLL